MILARANQITDQESTTPMDALEEPPAESETRRTTFLQSEILLIIPRISFKAHWLAWKRGTPRWSRGVVAVSALCFGQYLKKICSIIAVVTTWLQNHISEGRWTSQYAWRCACVDERR